MTKEEREEISEWEKIEVRKWCVERVLHSGSSDREVSTGEILAAARKLEQYIMKG